MKSLLFGILFLLLLTDSATATLSQNGTPASNTGIATAVTNITTIGNNNIVVVFAECQPNVSNCSVSGVSDVAGLTWNSRCAAACDSTLISLEEWWALAPTALTGDAVTVSYAATGGIGSSRNIIFAVSGADTVNPFDTNVSLPAFTTGTTATSLTNTISTANANSMLIASVRSANSLATITQPSGFTQIVSGGANMDGSYKVVSSAQSSLGVTYSWTGATVHAVMVTDAIQAPAGTISVNDPLWFGMTF